MSTSDARRAVNEDRVPLVLDDDLAASFTTTRIRPIHIRGVGLTCPIAVSRPDQG